MGPAEPTNSSNGPKSFSISKLARDGSNWITWKCQTLTTLAASHGVMRHIQGTARAPPPIPTFPTTRPLTADEEDQLEASEKCHDEYDQREAIIKVQIFTTIPDLLLIEVQKLQTSKEVWDALCAKHEKKALTVVVDIHRRMYEMKCEDK